MSTAWQFYISTLLIYLGVDVMACWALNLQFGVAGIINFAFIVFQAVGAYTAAVLTLGPESSNGGFQRYLGGGHWPFPLPILAGGIVAAAAALLVGVISLRRLRTDYQAMVMLVVSLIATAVVTNYIPLVNGPAGLSLIPQPLATVLSGLSSIGYQWFYVGLTAVVALLMYWIVHRVTGSPLGRALRAVRDKEAAAGALGKNVNALRIQAFVIGGFVAGVSGAVLVQFIDTWSPGAWFYPETFVYFTALIVGGTGNNLGAAVGALLVPIAFLEATRFLPQFGYPGLMEALQWVAVGLLALVFLWFWPKGLFPERRRRFPRTASTEGTAHVGEVEEVGLTGTVEADQEAPAPLLVVEDLRREFGGVRAVDGTSFEVQAETITALIGPNGAGKSTVVAMIGGSIRPTSGSIRFDGRELIGEPSHRVARQGVVRTFQLSAEFARLTVLENLLVAAPAQRGERLSGAFLGKAFWRLQERELVERARELLDRFRMSEKEDDWAGNLSGGQKRILEIMRGVMARPRLLLLDEPMAGVNPRLAEEIEQHLLRLRDEGLTMLMVEHEMGVVERLCHPVVVMASGKVISQGSMDEIRSNREVVDAYLVG